MQEDLPQPRKWLDEIILNCVKQPSPVSAFSSVARVRFLSRVTMVTREFGVRPFAQDSTSCKISRKVTKRQVNKVKKMNMYLL